MSTQYQNTIASAKTVSLSLPGGAIWFSISALLLYALGGESSNDAGGYQEIWNRLQDVDFSNAVSTLRYEIGWLLLYWSLSQFVSWGAAFFVMGLSALSVKYYLFQKYLHYPLFAWFIYLSIFLQAHDANQIRAALAACFILYALIVSKGGKSYLILAVIASLFHYSGLIILLLYFIRAPLIGLALIALLSPAFDFIAASLGLSTALLYLSSGYGHVNLLSSVSTAQLGLSMVCAFKWKSLTAAQKKGAYLIMIGTVLYFSFPDNPLLAHRLRELSLLGIFPLLFLGERKVTYSVVFMWSCVGYIVIYTLWAVIDELLSIYLVM